MDISFFEEFGIIVKNMSIAGAAKELHVTQAALSKRLESAEKEIGAILIERQQGAATFEGLTPAGRFFLRGSCEIGCAYRKTQLEIQNISQSMHPLRLLCSYRRPLASLIVALSKAMSDNCDSVVVEHVGMRAGNKIAFDLVRHNKIDLAIDAFSPMADTERLESLPIMRSKMALVFVSEDLSVVENIKAGGLRSCTILSLAAQSEYAIRKHIHCQCLQKGFSPAFELVEGDSNSIMLAEHLHKGLVFVCPSFCAEYYSGQIPDANYILLDDEDFEFDFRVFFKSCLEKSIRSAVENALGSSSIREWVDCQLGTKVSTS